MHGQTLRKSLGLGRNLRAVLRRPLHARDAEQRSGRRRTAPDPITSVCERERRPPANQADGAARTPAIGAIGTWDVRRLIRNVSCKSSEDETAYVDSRRYGFGRGRALGIGFTPPRSTMDS